MRTKEQNEAKNKARVTADIEAFLARGGVIEKCEIVVRSHKNLTEISQNANNLRRRDSKRTIGNTGNKKEITRY